MTKLTVAVRVRPLSEREISKQSIGIVSVEDGRTVAVTNIKVPEQNAGDSRERIRRFHFDYCFNCATSQEDVYAAISKEIIASIRDRLHLCILAYGQSASGKTHTMIGSTQPEADKDGVVPRLCRHLFDYLLESAIGSELENLSTSVSYLEIYNEKVRDLLNAPHASARGRTEEVLKVREHPQTGPYVQGLSERIVTDTSALLSLLHAGNANRTFGATNANPRSSRSHSVFTITCLGGLKLRFVDLAGSERAGTFSTSRCREGANINRSLVALRNVISALADWSQSPRRARKRFVPYRDSVLTWLLKDTLGGNSRTILVSTISPSSHSYSETVNTLRFGQRAKEIAVRPLFNEDPKVRTIRELRTEIARLRLLLEHIHKPPIHNQLPSVVHTLQQDWETTGLIARCDSASGRSKAHNLKPSDVALQPVEDVIVVDQLIPFVDIDVDMSEPIRPAFRTLKRTMSMDQRAGEQTPTTSSLSSSQELLTDGSETSMAKSVSTSRKVSIDSPKNTGKRPELKSKVEQKPKLDTYRKASSKPRSQIVAAVTQRLYNKVKKKDASTDTLGLCDPVRVQSITTKARNRLLELTEKALKAHRRRSVETQTSLFPVLRLKEIATDVDDLRLASEQIVHAETATDAILTIEVGTNCSFMNSFQPDEDRPSGITLTRSCGTSTECLLDPLRSSSEHDKSPASPNSSLSFTRYLMPQTPSPTLEIVNPASTNPIYTSSVNINVNHNYLNGCKLPQTQCDVLSEDSLEESQCVSNVCFPTPDLISNHNSLEPHAPESHMHQARTSTVEESNVDGTGKLQAPERECMKAKCSLQELHVNRVKSEFQTKIARQVRTDALDLEDYDLFYDAPPQRLRPHMTREALNEAIQGEEPIILKSIMKCPEGFSDDGESETLFDNVPDSLNYYYEKARKKVRFESQMHEERRSKQDDRMLEAMVNFMKEVTTLMNNLTRVASQLDRSPSEQIYDMEVTVNDIHRHSSLDSQQSDRSQFSESTQTMNVTTRDTSTEMQFEDFPVNRFESLVELSCERLENVVQKACTERRELNRYPTAFSLASDWNCRSGQEDSSLESQPTFSDYGSLPRRRRTRSSLYSPSSYLRQLTNMRRDIIKHSRDELLQATHMHL